MAREEAGIWVCGECRSVNKLRAKQCYHCRTPRDRAAVNPAEVTGTGHGKLREIALPDFHSSRGEAALASVLILAVAAIQVVVVVMQAQFMNRMLELGILTDPDVAAPPDFESTIATVATTGLVSIGVALLALGAWAFWLSRVVGAMPALGLGYPPTNPLMAFVENFIPFLNLFRVPAIVRDVVRRLDPGVTSGQSRGDALIFAAWIGLIGGYFIPRIGGFLNLGADTVERAVGNALLVQGVATGLVVVGALFLVVLIWWIEARIAKRRSEQLEGPPQSGLATVPEAVEPRVSTPMDSPMPFSAAAAPFAPPTQVSPTPEPLRPHVPTGPRLHVQVQSGSSMIATLEGESEAITMDELRAAAAALARADGSAVIATAASSDEARSMAEQAIDIFADAKVPATMER